MAWICGQKRRRDSAGPHSDRDPIGPNANQNAMTHTRRILDSGFLPARICPGTRLKAALLALSACSMLVIALVTMLAAVSRAAGPLPPI